MCSRAGDAASSSAEQERTARIDEAMSAGQDRLRVHDQKLLELGLLKVLHTGDGSKDNLLRRCWGKNLQLGTKQSLDE